MGVEGSGSATCHGINGASSEEKIVLQHNKLGIQHNNFFLLNTANVIVRHSMILEYQ